MDKIKVQIVEDDPSYALELEMMLRDLGCTVPPLVREPKELQLKKDNLPDILVSDILFNNKPLGIELLGKMKREGIPVILLTSQANENIYHQSRGLLPAGFAIKPIAPLSLKSLIENALIQDGDTDALHQVLDDWSCKQIINRHLFVRHGGALVRVVVSEISYIEADGNYCFIHENDRRYVVKSSLRHLKKLLTAQGFLQINRGQLINYNLIKSVDFANNTLECGDHSMTIGSAYRKEVESWLNRI